MLKFTKQKKLIIALSLAVSTTSTFIATNTEAAILVYDAANVAKAIETAINTASILNEEQKQLALMLVNMKKFDGQAISEFCVKNGGALFGTSTDPLNENVENPLGEKWEINTEKIEEIGQDVEDIFAGRATLADIYFKRQDVEKAVNKVLKKTVETVKESMKQDKEVLEKNEKIVKTEPEGEMQALQANTAVNANTGQLIADNNELMRHLVTNQAQEYAIRNQERAAADAEAKRQHNLGSAMVAFAKTE